MWNDADKTIFDIFDLLNRNDRAPLKCPVCGKKDAHLYMYRWKEKKNGSIWVWCSQCKASCHERVQLPDWWKNATVIDDNLLGIHPDMLDENKQFVDAYLNLLLKDIYPNELTQEKMKRQYHEAKYTDKDI